MISRFEQLENREKLFIIGGGVILIVMLLIYAAYIPYLHAIERADKSIQVKLKQIEEVKQMQLEYLALKEQLASLESHQGQGSRLSALTLIEDLASRIGSRDNLVNIRPQTAQVQGDYRVENVDVRFERMPLAQLVRLLKGLETSQGQIQVKSLQVKQRFDDKALVDLNMTVSSFRKNQ